MNNQERIESLRKGLILSCQVRETDPMYSDDIIVKLVACGEWGGACAYRINEPQNVKAVRAVTDKPIIGLWKINPDEADVFITPSMKEVDAVIEAGADIIAVDCTDRVNSEGVKAYEIIKEIKKKYPEVLILADIRNAEEAVRAAELGAHMVAPTLYRFSEDAKSTSEPDFRELAKIVEEIGDKAKVVMEGKINTPDQAIKALYLGAYSVVVGSAITRPHLTTLRYTTLMKGMKDDLPLRY